MNLPKIKPVKAWAVTHHPFVGSFMKDYDTECLKIYASKKLIPEEYKWKIFRIIPVLITPIAPRKGKK